MKFSSIICFLITLTVSSEIVGQSVSLKEKESNWVIGPILYSESGTSFEPNFLPGIILKRKYNLYTVRTSLEYNTSIDKKDLITCCDIIRSEGYGKTGLLKIGVEKGILINNFFRPYLATDLTAIKSFYDQTLEGGMFYTHERRKRKVNSLGIFQTVGLEFLLNKKVSLAMETSFSFLRTKNYQKTTSLIDSYIIKTSTNTQFHMDLHLISAFTLNIHF